MYIVKYMKLKSIPIQENNLFSDGPCWFLIIYIFAYENEESPLNKAKPSKGGLFIYFFTVNK